MGISPELDREFCSILNGWQALEKTLPDGVTIVDFNLPEWHGTTGFQKRQQVLYELDQIIASDESKSDRHFFQRAYGLRAYMLDVLNKQTTPIDEFLPATMGFKSTFLPEEYVIAMRERARESLAKVGVPLENALKGLAEKSRLIPVDEIPSWFSAHFIKALGKTKAIFPIPPELPEPDVSIFEEDSMVKASITGAGKRLSLTFNKRTVLEESEERLEGTLRHEILGHGIQVAVWADHIEAGRWNMNRGITCMQGVEAFHMECLAEYSSVFYADKSDIQTANNHLAFAGRVVNNNFNHMLYHGEKDGALRAYYTDHLPFRGDAFAQQRVDHVRSNSLRRCYSSVYGPGLRLSTHIMESLEEPKQTEFLREMYEGYMDATDIQNLGIKLGATALPSFTPMRPAEVAAVAAMAP